MAEPQPGAQVARDLGIPLGQLYSWVKRGLVVNHKEGGYPEGKGLIVDPTEAKLAWMSSKKKGPRAARSPREPKAKRVAGEPEPTKSGTRRLSTGTIVSYSSHATGSRFDEKKPPVYTLAQVLGAGNELTYVDTASERRIHYTGRVIDNTFYGTERLATMLAKGVARIENPVWVLGMILLAFVTEGKLELAESLESWMIDNDLEVRVPEIVDVGTIEDEVIEDD